MLSESRSSIFSFIAVVVASISLGQRTLILIMNPSYQLPTEGQQRHIAFTDFPLSRKLSCQMLIDARLFGSYRTANRATRGKTTPEN